MVGVFLPVLTHTPIMGPDGLPAASILLFNNRKRLRMRLPGCPGNYHKECKVLIGVRLKIVPKDKTNTPGATSDIQSLLTLETLHPNRFRNCYNQSNAYDNLFGGQIVAQSLVAADATVKGFSVHSLHGYFLRPGKADVFVEFDIDRVRDGRRFSSRQVTARQNGKAIFTMACSYRVQMEGYEHQQSRTLPFEPEQGIDFSELARSGRFEHSPLIHRFREPQPIEVRIPGEPGFLQPGDSPQRHYWLRARNCPSVDDPMVHRQIFSYLTDFLLPGAALAPHAIALPGPHVFMASLDHTVWFHRDMRCDDWLLFETDSPNAHQGVNLARGLVYNRKGELVATIAQEALQLPTGSA